MCASHPEQDRERRVPWWHAFDCNHPGVELPPVRLRCRRAAVGVLQSPRPLRLPAETAQWGACAMRGGAGGAGCGPYRSPASPQSRNVLGRCPRHVSHRREFPDFLLGLYQSLSAPECGTLSDLSFRALPSRGSSGRGLSKIASHAPARVSVGGPLAPGGQCSCLSLLATLPPQIKNHATRNAARPICKHSGLGWF